MMEGISLIEMARTRRALAVERLTVLRVTPLGVDEAEVADEPRSAPPRRLPPAAISPFTGQGCRKLIEPYRDPRAVFRNGSDEHRPLLHKAPIPVPPVGVVGREAIGQSSAGVETGGLDLAPPLPLARPAPRNRQGEMVNLLLQQVRQ